MVPIENIQLGVYRRNSFHLAKVLESFAFRLISFTHTMESQSTFYRTVFIKSWPSYWTWSSALWARSVVTVLEACLIVKGISHCCHCHLHISEKQHEHLCVIFPAGDTEITPTLFWNVSMNRSRYVTHVEQPCHTRKHTLAEYGLALVLLHSMPT